MCGTVSYPKEIRRGDGEKVRKWDPFVLNYSQALVCPVRDRMSIEKQNNQKKHFLIP